ncbi:MAG: hypothetical protein ABT21_02520 [Thiobacillus sp. SCN 65-179]|nr:MAG: hypothetical protein ABT21_02520 [Thiobacillus sp. SCN 65-179]
MIMLRILIVWFLSLSAVGAWADGPAGKPLAHIERLMDMRANNQIVRDPRRALEMADAMTEPELLAAVMALSTQPDIWLKAMERAGAPDVPGNLAGVADPALFAEWFYSSIDPQYQHAIVSRLLDPAKAQRWVQAMANPRFYTHALAVMSPAASAQWMKVAQDGRMAASMRVWFDPNTYLGWMRLPAAEPDKAGPGGQPFPYWPPPRRY